MSFFNNAIQIFIDYLPLFLHGIRVTLLISLTGTIIGLLIGLVIGGLRAIKIEVRDKVLVRVLKRIMHILTGTYVEIFRGTPMMVQAMFLYYSLLKPIFGFDAITSGIIIVSINTGAYMAEIIRAGIQSVDLGQTEAARSIGMSAMQTMFYIILPQAIKNSFPSIGNEFVVNIKDTSVLNVITVTEIYFQTIRIAGSTFSFAGPFFITAVVYFVLTYTTTIILKTIEHRLHETKSSYPASQTVPQSNVINKGD